MSNFDFDHDDFAKTVEAGFRQVRRFGLRVLIAVLAFWAFIFAGIIFAVVKIAG